MFLPALLSKFGISCCIPWRHWAWRFRLFAVPLVKLRFPMGGTPLQVFWFWSCAPGALSMEEGLGQRCGGERDVFGCMEYVWLEFHAKVHASSRTRQPAYFFFITQNTKICFLQLCRNGCLVPDLKFPHLFFFPSSHPHTSTILYILDQKHSLS